MESLNRAVESITEKCSLDIIAREAYQLIADLGMRIAE